MMTNNTVASMLAAGALTVLALPATAQSNKSFEPYDIPMPSTSSLIYTVINARRVGTGQIEVITRAAGKISGDLYEQRLVDCTRPRFQILGESATLKGLKNKTGGARVWLQLPAGFTTEVVYKAACERLTLLEP